MSEIKTASSLRLTAKTLILAALPVVVAAYIGSSATIDAIDPWYRALAKPAFNPPNWIFGPAWGVLYVMMIIAFWRVLSTVSDGAKLKPVAIGVFLAQMVLNGAWSVAFFGLKSPYGALFIISALWLGIVTTILLFWKIDKVAALLLVPYILWVSFATYLNAGIFWLNR